MHNLPSNSEINIIRSIYNNSQNNLHEETAEEMRKRFAEQDIADMEARAAATSITDPRARQAAMDRIRNRNRPFSATAAAAEERARQGQEYLDRVSAGVKRFHSQLGEQNKKVDAIIELMKAQNPEFKRLFGGDPKTGGFNRSAVEGWLRKKYGTYDNTGTFINFPKPETDEVPYYLRDPNAEAPKPKPQDDEVPEFLRDPNEEPPKPKPEYDASEMMQYLQKYRETTVADKASRKQKYMDTLKAYGGSIESDVYDDLGELTRQRILNRQKKEYLKGKLGTPTSSSSAPTGGGGPGSMSESYYNILSEKLDRLEEATQQERAEARAKSMGFNLGTGHPRSRGAVNVAAIRPERLGPHLQSIVSSGGGEKTFSSKTGPTSTKETPKQAGWGEKLKPHIITLMGAAQDHKIELSKEEAVNPQSRDRKKLLAKYQPGSDIHKAAYAVDQIMKGVKKS